MIMEKRDEFAVWLATTVLDATGDAFSAAALSDLAERSGADGLDAKIKEATINSQRPGDFGIEFVGPLLPVLLVEFGRMLWDAYAKAVVEEGGKELAGASIKFVRDALHRTFGGRGGPLSVADAEAKLREAGEKANLTAEQIDELLRTLRDPEAVRALAGE